MDTVGRDQCRDLGRAGPGHKDSGLHKVWAWTVVQDLGEAAFSLGGIILGPRFLYREILQ